MAHHLFADRTGLADLCRRHKIRRLSRFGSVLKGTARPDSDVDRLVEFEPAAVPGLLALAAIENELPDLLDRRRVDLRIAQELSPFFRELARELPRPQSFLYSSTRWIS